MSNDSPNEIVLHILIRVLMFVPLKVSYVLETYAHCPTDTKRQSRVWGNPIHSSNITLQGTKSVGYVLNTCALLQELTVAHEKVKH